MPGGIMFSDPLPPFTATDYIADPRHWPALLLGGYLAFCNLATFSIGEALDDGLGLLIAYAMCGSIGAEFAILPAWLVWGVRPLRQRACLALLAALMLFVLWALSLGHFPWSLFPGSVFLFLPAVTLAVVMPLAVLRFLFHWRIVFIHQPEQFSPPLGIRHLLGITTLVVLSLAAARAGMHLHGMARELSSWVYLGIGTAATVLATILVVVPVLWWTLGPGHAWRNAIAIGLLATILPAIPIAVALAFNPRWPPLIMILAPFVIIASFAYTTAAPFWLACAAGYRLQIGRARRDTIDDN